MLTPLGSRTSIVGDDDVGFVTVIDGSDGDGDAAAGVDTTGSGISSIAPVEDTSATWTKPGSDADDNCRARIDQYRTILNDTPRWRANSLID